MRKRLLYILAIAAFILSACGQKQNEPPQPSGEGTTAAANLSPTPTQTPTPQPRARITIGEGDILNGDYEAALNEFWTARQQSSDPDVIAAAQLGVGKVNLLVKDYQGAIEQLLNLQNNFSSGEPRNLAYFYLAKAYEGLGDYLKAAEAYGQYVAQASGPLNSEILEMKGDALMKVEDPTAAREAYLQASESVTEANREWLEIKIARASAEAGDDNDAINRYLSLLENSENEAVLSQSNFLLGQIYLRQGLTEQAYARFQDSVIRFPTYYDSYSGLVALVEGGQPVDDLLRGIVDYYAGQYGLTVVAMDRYMSEHPDHDGTPLYYKALSLWQLGDYEGEIATWDILITEYPTDQFASKATMEKASSMWRYLEDYQGAAQTLLTFVASYPDAPQASSFLNTAAKIYEIGGYLSKAAKTWLRVFNEYPASEEAANALFQAGIMQFRLQNYQDARLNFQRLLVLTSNQKEIAAANLWIAKCYQKEGNPVFTTYLEQAAAADPTGYYSIRATQLMAGEEPFAAQANADFSIDLAKEKKKADKWLRSTFKIDTSIDLSGLGDLTSNPLFDRGEEFWKLGLRDQARSEFNQLREELQADVVNSYRLMNHMVELGFYQTASLTSRQILDLAGLSQAATLSDAPIYFNHIRFGIFYRDIILPAAVENKIDPLLLFSIIRQESLFDASIESSAGARGLMQITPDTGEYIVANFGWPQNYTAEDLDRPCINIPLGAHYLKLWIDKYEGSIPYALASYNAGDGNTIVWQAIAGEDVDLFVESIRFEETRNYIQYITENYEIYKNLYTHP